MTSSASKPSSSTCGMSRASRTSWISGICPLKASGVADRVALYSGYSTDRKVFRETSKATPTWVGFSSRRVLMSIEVKP